MRVRRVLVRYSGSGHDQQHPARGAVRRPDGFDDPRRGERVDVHAAHIPRDQQVREPGLHQAVDELAGEPALAVYRRGRSAEVRTEGVRGCDEVCGGHGGRHRCPSVPGMPMRLCQKS
jgi:hypothetical protein